MRVPWSPPSTCTKDRTAGTQIIEGSLRRRRTKGTQPAHTAAAESTCVEELSQLWTTSFEAQCLIEPVHGEAIKWSTLPHQLNESLEKTDNRCEGLLFKQQPGRQLNQAVQRSEAWFCATFLFFVSCALVSLSLSVTGERRRETKRGQRRCCTAN